MSHDDEASRFRLRQLPEELERLRAHGRVEVGRRLVSEEHARRSGDGRAIATRCFCPPDRSRGRKCSLSLRPTRVSLLRLRARLPAADALDVERVLDVLEGGQGGEQVVLLEHEAMDFAPYLAQLVFAGGAHVPPCDLNAPAVGVRMQPMIDRSVVLPDPDGPSRLPPRLRDLQGDDLQDPRDALSAFFEHLHDAFDGED